MGNIKNIYTFGTSWTEGGGFEFDKPKPKYNSDDLYNIYGNTDEELTRKNFSWPGQLSKICKNLNIINHAKSGYGNERLYRKAFEEITNPKFDKEHSLFLFEFSDLGRKEIYHKEIGDYIILNYYWEHPIQETDLKISSFANSYYYDSDEVLNILSKDYDLLKSFLEKTIDFYNVVDLLNRNMHMFISFLEFNQIKYHILTTEYVNWNQNLKTTENLIKEKRVKLNLKNDTYNDVMELFTQYGLSLKNETNGVINDGAHLGYNGSKLIANLVSSFLVNEGYIDSDINLLDIDWNIIKKI